MTDRFNRKAQEILRDGDSNGGLTNRSLFDLMVAAHDESVEVAKVLATKVEDRCDEFDARFEKLDCIVHPRAPRRSYDEPDANYRSARKDEDRRLWVMWNVVISIVKDVALPVIVAVLATLLLTGTL